MKTKSFLCLIWIVLILSLFLSGCGGRAPEETAPPPSTPTVGSQPEGTLEPEADGAAGAEDAEPAEEIDPLSDIVGTRELQPTSTPDAVAQRISEFTRSTGMAWKTFLGLTGEDWINLGVSLLIVLIVYVIAVIVTGVLLRTVARRTTPEIGRAITKAIGPYLKWLVATLVFGLATNRLVFLSVYLKHTLSDVYFVVGLILASLIAWNLIEITNGLYHEQMEEEERVEEMDPVIILFTRVSHIFLVLVALSIGLAYFGINVIALSAALGIGGLALSLAAQDTLADAISGFIILADRPYRMGDRIEIQGLDTWGDVEDIGLRTTRIRTRDNRMIIVPNSSIARNQVINYTYPDPRYRIQAHVGLAYGTDIETARRVIVQAVSGVEGVLPDKPVEALYDDMGDSAMIFRVRWWIESYEDTRHVYDRVYTRLQAALDEAGIDSPYPIQNVHLQVEPETVDRISKTWGNQHESSRR